MTTSIKTLIEDRCRELGLCRREFLDRLNYTNRAKAARRYDELLAGNLHTTRGLIEMLPEALDVPSEVVNEAVANTKREMGCPTGLH